MAQLGSHEREYISAYDLATIYAGLRKPGETAVRRCAGVYDDSQVLRITVGGPFRRTVGTSLKKKAPAVAGAFAPPGLEPKATGGEPGLS
jgi:hypothetical protein